jgi:hypothetical protein
LRDYRSDTERHYWRREKMSYIANKYTGNVEHYTPSDLYCGKRAATGLIPLRFDESIVKFSMITVADVLAQS